MDTGIGRNLMEIASLLLGIALVALIVGQSDKVVPLIKQGGTTFNDLLRTVTLQNGIGGLR